jgi:threonine/homoserine/homoserine lactone efflux protein
MTFAWLSGYAVVLSRVREVVVRGPVKRLLDVVAGTVLVGFGVRLAAE